MNPQEIVVKCVDLIAEKKGSNIVSQNISGITSIADYFLICTGANDKQVQAICDNVQEKMTELGEAPLRLEGYREGKWALLDFGAVIVHIFQPEERLYYNLERLWADAPTTNY